MKTNSGLIHYKSKGAYLARQGNKALNPEDLKSTLEKVDGVSKIDDASKADLTQKSKGLKNSNTPLKEDLKEGLKEKIKTDKGKIKKAAKHLLMDGAKTLKGALDIVSFPKVPLSLINESNAPIKEISEKILKVDSKPASVFFISGLDLTILGDADSDLENLSKFVKDADHFSWKDENTVLENISKLDKTKPLMLIGHSLGGDAVVNLANKLNSAEHGFRKIDLLVTLDSVGFNNDIIPQNVRLNHNFISDQDYLFNDGPNIARDYTKTKINNFLKDKLHTEMDGDISIQADIIEQIEKIQKNYSTDFSL